MIVSNGYSLMYDEKRNFILIGLPQTMETATNTIGQIVDRRTDITEADLTVLLNIAQLIFHKAERKGDAEDAEVLETWNLDGSPTRYIKGQKDEQTEYHIENDGTYRGGEDEKDSNSI